VADACQERGVDAVVMPTDVTDEAAMVRLADEAFDRFGRLDVWVNAAAVALFAKMERVPMDELRRVFEVNVFGYIHGVKAALPVFQVQRRGVLINVDSMVGKISEPYAGAYVMSKHAVKALGMVVRQELALEHQRHVHVCTVMPATIDTPFFQHAANHTGRPVKAMPPVYSAERVARTIVHCAQAPRREVYVGNAGRMLGYQYKVAPRFTEWLAALMTDQGHLGHEPAEDTSGNLFAPMDDPNRVDGGWNGARNTTLRRAATATAVATIAAGIALARPATEAGSPHRD